MLSRQFQDSIVDHSSKCHIDRLVPVFIVGHAEECLKLPELKSWNKINLSRFRLSTVILDNKHPCLFVNTQGMGRGISETRLIKKKIVKSQLIKLAQAIWVHNTTDWV